MYMEGVKSIYARFKAVKRGNLKLKSVMVKENCGYSARLRNM